MRKLLIYTILLSMALHCGCRLGFLDHLYNKRHEIAYAVGLIAEVPIALCGGHYDPPKTFTIKPNSEAQSLPPAFIKAEPINLFFVAEYSQHDGEKILLNETQSPYFQNLYQLVLVKPVFHPPSVVV
jgi:hypothetical protein